jgi:predicted membrane-bound spermidine synthase
MPLRFFYAVFLLAGMPALVYQVVWQRVLTLYFGVDIYSTTVTVASFMLGLGVGSLAGGRLADQTPRPVRWYVAVELLIGLYGAASLYIFSAVGERLAGSPLAVLVPVNFLLLLAPALLMGMTLPLMCRIVATSDATIGQQLSRLYGVNTLGAALGALISAYLLIGLWGLDGATWAAATVNITLAAVVAVAGWRAPAQAAATNPAIAPMAIGAAPDTELRYLDVLGLSFLSGFIALGYEIVWYRLLGCLLHGTVYVFGAILCLFLLGIALGSLASKKRIDQPGAAGRFAKSQLGIAAYTLVLFLILGHASWLPGIKHVIGATNYTSRHPSPDLIDGFWDLENAYSIIDMPAWIILMTGVPTFLMGYGFPNLLRAGSHSVAGLGTSVGRIYFANIVGSTVGTLLFGFFLLEYAGSEGALSTLILLGLTPIFLWAARMTQRSETNATRGWLACSAAILLVTLFVFPRVGDIIKAIHYADHDVVHYVAGREDKTGIVVMKNQREVISFPQEEHVVGRYRVYIDGAGHGGMTSLETVNFDHGVELLLAAHRRPKRVLCIGLGDGMMCAAAIKHPQVAELIVVELNGALREVLEHSAQGRYVSDSPKVRYVVDDGRRWLLANPDEKFDVILMWPLHAAHAHSGSLFSMEFFALARRHMADGGLLLARSVDGFSTARTLALSFPHVVCRGDGEYIASLAPIRFDLAAAGVERQEFLDSVASDAQTILAHTADAPLNRDFAPRAEYYITYPWRWCLSTRRPTTDRRYRETDRQRFEELILKE